MDRPSPLAPLSEGDRVWCMLGDHGASVLLDEEPFGDAPISCHVVSCSDPAVARGTPIRLRRAELYVQRGAECHEFWRRWEAARIRRMYVRR